MKTALFTLAALFGLGLGLAVVGVEFGRLLLVTLLAFLSLAALLWALADRLPPLRTHAIRRITPLAALVARLKSGIPALAAWRFLPPLLSALMGLALGAALAHDNADLPAALLCGALAAALHLMAFSPGPRNNKPLLQPDPITDRTEADLARLITALAPCRDPHLHVAARALRRQALALAAQVDSAPMPQTESRHALTLWLPALTEAAGHLRAHCLIQHDPAPIANLTATLDRVTAQLARLASQPDTPPAAGHRKPPPLVQVTG